MSVKCWIAQSLYFRTQGKSIVCDVNGWSFVKGSQIYYDNCARILREIFHRAHLGRGLPLLQPIPNKRVRRGVVGVFRHADRTPKQVIIPVVYPHTQKKLKMKISNKEFLAFFEQTGGKDVKLKNDNSQEELDKILQIALRLLEHPGWLQ